MPALASVKARPSRVSDPNSHLRMLTTVLENCTDNICQRITNTSATGVVLTTLEGLTSQLKTLQRKSNLMKYQTLRFIPTKILLIMSKLNHQALCIKRGVRTALF